MNSTLKRRLQRLEREAGAAQAPIVIRIVYEDALHQTRQVAPWHVEVHGSVSRVVHGEGEA
jgi:hypothetical protein